MISRESLSSLCAPPLRNRLWMRWNLCSISTSSNFPKFFGLTISRNSLQRVGDSPRVFHSLHTLTTHMR